MVWQMNRILKQVQDEAVLRQKEVKEMEERMEKLRKELRNSEIKGSLVEMEK
jgi:polyhydroxyalkanoate synthesis regulator phasin